MRVALAQTAPVLGDLDANFARAKDAIAQARGEGADVVVFPELSLTGYGVGQVDRDLDLDVDDPRLLALAEQAGDGGVLVGFQEGGHVLHSYNAAAYFEGGEFRHLHRKLYLPTWGIFEERKHFSPGQSLRAYDTRWGRMATLICNDAWQPQLAFIAAQDGARLLFMPSTSAQIPSQEAWSNETYWRDIARFYARMYQCFVVFVNRVGQEGPMRFWGGSQVLDPWGEIVAEAPHDTEAVVVADVDLAQVRRRRRHVPLVKEARLALLEREIRRLADEGGDL
ncbi:MAG: amidohydrolase [Actinomycetota bacterium]|nr:amidohydrolase [Actinomycetota bacterium]